METCIINSPLGFTKIVGDEDGIAAVTVLNDIKCSEEKSIEKITDIIPVELEDCVIQLNEYFEGNRTKFDLKLNPQGTDFQKKLWNIKAIRAVASANGKNPIWIIVPCHRVIGNDASLTGYAGGLHRKKWLLDHESPYKQQTLF